MAGAVFVSRLPPCADHDLCASLGAYSFVRSSYDSGYAWYATAEQARSAATALNSAFLHGWCIAAEYVHSASEEELKQKLHSYTLLLGTIHAARQTKDSLAAFACGLHSIMDTLTPEERECAVNLLASS